MKRIPLILLALALPLSACHSSQNDKDSKKRAPLVTTALVTQGDVPMQLSGVGTVEAYSTVAVRAQVGGELKRIYFKQGQDVQKDAPLFQIDPRLPLAALRQAEATLAKDQAQANNARAQFQRYEALFKEGGVSREQFDQMQANLSALEATLQGDRANVDNAKTQLSYMTLRAPISGRTGSFLLTAGNIIKANDLTPLVVINQIQPIYVTFSLPQQDLLELRKHPGQLPVLATLHGSPESAMGKLTFVDNAVDTTTGTIRLKATFPNQNKRLWPGQFVDVGVTLSHRADALMVPSQATQLGQDGKYVYVVKQDKTVEARPVTVSRSWQGFDVVERGVSLGEMVVTDGQMQLTPGAKVRLAEKRRHS